jgi:hypothetical protein
MKAGVGFLSLEQELSVLTAGTVGCAAACLYCGIGASDVFLILVALYTFVVSGIMGSARWTSQRKLFRVAQLFHWGCLALFFLIGVLVIEALSGNIHWAYTHNGPVRPFLFTLQMTEPELMPAAKPEGAEVEKEKEKDEKPKEVWAMGGTLEDHSAECIFPFTFEGVTYHECASEAGPPSKTLDVKTPREHPWCMTDAGSGIWGYCLLSPSWTGPVETVAHTRSLGMVAQRILVLMFIVMCQLVFSSFSICVLESLDVEEAQERRFKDGYRGYGSIDSQVAPTYSPGYGSMYAPVPVPSQRARVTSSYTPGPPGSAAGSFAYAPETMFVPAAR